LIPLYTSGQWSPRTNRAVANVYGIDSDPPSIIGSAGVHRPLTEVLPRAFLSDLLLRQDFMMTAVNYLAGRSILGIPVVPIFGLLAIVWTLLRMRGRSALFVAAGAMLVCSLIVDGWVASDLVRAAVRDEHRWRTQHAYRDMSDLYVMAAKAQKEADTHPGWRIGACGQVADIVRYLIFPHPLENPHEADVVILLPAWRMKNGKFLCGDKDEIIGDHLQQFPNGGALLFRNPLIPHTAD
jgi:hypothetical protein